MLMWFRSCEGPESGVDHQFLGLQALDGQGLEVSATADPGIQVVADLLLAWSLYESFWLGGSGLRNRLKPNLPLKATTFIMSG